MDLLLPDLLCSVAFVEIDEHATYYKFEENDIRCQALFSKKLSKSLESTALCSTRPYSFASWYNLPIKETDEKVS